jgi:hypothetical protein
MKTKSLFPRAALLASLLSTFNLPLSTFAQGSLTPPGAPAPTMKTLAQIEPRTPISSVPFTISAAGSYYLTTNLTPGINQNGIVIAADNVTIDLNGFTLFGGGGGSGEGISASGARANIVVLNGTLRNWPGSGVNFYDSGSSQAIIQNIRSISNVFTGIAIKKGSRAVDCVAVGNGGRGILVDNDCLVDHCKAASNVGGGIEAGATSQLINNQTTANGSGILITGAGNIVANNIVKANTDNYNLAQGNQLDLLLCELPESIDWSANVKLVGSLNVTVSNAVTITANGVTLDLGGFTISSTAPSATGAGILINNGLRNLAIRNGFIQGGVINNGGVYNGSGFRFGINGSPQNARVSGVSVSGCLNSGIFLGSGSSTVVESCTVLTAGGFGIVASTIKDSVARDCGGDGIDGDQVADCRGESTGSGYGLFTAGSALNCYGSSVNGYGLQATTANDCYGLSVNGTGLDAVTANNCGGEADGSGYGIYVSDIAIGCKGWSENGTGLRAYIANSCRGATFVGTDQNVTYKYNMP